MKHLLLALMILLSATCYAQDVITFTNVPANRIMRRIARYYHARVVFEPGFPLHSRTILGGGHVGLKGMSPQELADDLSWNEDEFVIEFKKNCFYVRLLKGSACAPKMGENTL